MFRTKDNYGNIKYVGRSKATVVDNRDPESRGRIIIDSPVLGITGWVDYLHSPNTFDIPSIGDVVYVEADGGEYEFPIAWGNLTKTVDGSNDIPEQFERTVPTNRGIYSPNGNLIELDDGISKPTNGPDDTDLTTESRGIRISTKSGFKIFIHDDSEAGIEMVLIEDPSGDRLLLDSKSKTIELNSKGKITQLSNDMFSITSNESMEVHVPNGPESHTVKNFTVATQQDNQQTSTGLATFSGLGGTTVGNTASTTFVDGSSVKLAGGETPLLLSTAQFVGVGNLGAPVISTLMVGATSKVTGE